MARPSSFSSIRATTIAWKAVPPRFGNGWPPGRHASRFYAFQGIKANEVEAFDKFVDILVKEGLLLTEPAPEGHQPKSPIPQNAIAFEAPKITKYNDMQTLLMSDPIHDVDEQTGWPNLEGEKA